MTELDTMVTRGRIALKSDKATLKTVAEAMVAGEAVEAPGEVKLPPLPQRVELTDADKQAMDGLSMLFCNVVPESRRTLTEQEIRTLHLEREAIRIVTGKLSSRDEAIKETVRNHLDAKAEEQNRAVPRALVDSKTGEIIVPATPRDAHGHYVLATAEQREEVRIPGTDKVFVREYRAPKTSVDTERLLAMYEDGEITREEYLAFTRSIRVIDEDKVWDFIKKNHERGLEILAAVTTHGLPGTAFNVRKVK